MNPELVKITEKILKIILISAVCFTILHFVIKSLLYWEKRFMNKILDRIEYSNEFAVAYAHVNDLIYIRERVVNRNTLPVPNIMVDFSTPSTLQFPDTKTSLVNLSRVISGIFSLEQNQRITRNRKVICTSRGFYHIKAASLSIRGFFSGSLFSRAVDINSKLWVYPEFIDMRTFFKFNSSPMGEILVRRWIMEDPFLYSGVRAYQPGDAFKKIHWGLTARNMEIMVRQNDYTSEMKLCIALNIQPSPKLFNNVIDKKIAETGIKVAATLVDHATQVNAPVCFLCNSIRRESRNEIEIIDYGKGKKHFSHIMENMAQLLINNSRTLMELIEYAYANINDSEIVFITHYVSYDALIAAGRLTGKGNKIQFIIMDKEGKYSEVTKGFDALYLLPEKLSV